MILLKMANLIHYLGYDTYFLYSNNHTVNAVWHIDRFLVIKIKHAKIVTLKKFVLALFT